ncbi:MAG: RtcB family protein [Nanoarchaeota archaeon]|nr:RtcB family protein [Nanoarchaeota archaeon]
MGKDSRVLDAFGTVRKIKDFEKTFNKDSIKCVNPTKKVKNTNILLFMKKKVSGLYKVKTSSSYEVTATEDHPFFTKSGMTELKYLKPGDSIAIYPFKGISYEEPGKKSLVEEESIKSLNLTKTSELQIIKTLKSKKLLPLKTNNPKLPYLLKLFGFIIGDGTIYFTKTKGTIWFYGKKDDLELIREDIKRLGFKPSRVYQRNRDHKIKTQYKQYNFNRTEYSFKTTSTSLARLLELLNIPIGNKCNQDYSIPQWILGLKKWQKRLFLAALFGAELSSPSTMTNHNYNFYCPVLSLNKSDKNIQSGIRFLEQIRQLLKEFSIKSKIIKQRRDKVNEKISNRLRLAIYQKSDNLIKLWSTVGYEYNKEKTVLANLATFWLENKKRFLKKNRLPNIRIGQQRGLFFYDFVSFVKNSRIESGIVWDTIENKKELPYDDYVYDFTVESDHHNFIANNFIVSNCGVRLLRTDFTEKDVHEKRVQLLEELFKEVPSGVGKGGITKLSRNILKEVLEKGSEWAQEQGYGSKEDLKKTEENGRIKEADQSKVSERALSRGIPQLGTLGAGNHFLELQKVDKIYDEKIAKIFGIEKEGQVTVMIHCGSRGLGHQVASDYIQSMEQKYGYAHLADRELINAPISSDMGKDYYAAMCCAINYAFANRQMITHWTRDVFQKVIGTSEGMKLVYDVCHNVAKFEEHMIEGEKRKVCVHRKGATRSFGPERKEVPEIYRDIGQPVLIPGSMGTASYLLVGTKKAEEISFGSTAHGAGRVMSRHEALRNWRGEQIKTSLKQQKDIELKAASWQGLAEEAPGAYKDIDEVVRVSHGIGIGNMVCRLVPLAVMKG